jgi:hypothetical protein
MMLTAFVIFPNTNEARPTAYTETYLHPGNCDPGLGRVP